MLRSGPASALPGRVARIEALSDSVTEERVAQVVFDRLPAGLVIGELAEVTVSLPASAPGLVVLNASLRQDGDQAGTWRMEGGVPRFLPVTPGAASLDGRVLITAAPTRPGSTAGSASLAEGDQVVEYSEQALDGRRRIQVVERLAGPPP